MGTNTYLVVTHSANVNNVLRLVVKTFPDHEVRINKHPFPLDRLYCYLFISEKDIELVLHDRKLKNRADVTLLIYTDIATIPLMDNAISDSKKSS